MSEISLFFGRFRRLDSSVGGSVGWIRPLQALLANITPPITAISYYISITCRARSILYCAAGNTTHRRGAIQKYNREGRNTFEEYAGTVLVVWKLFFWPSEPSPRTDRRTLPKEFNTPRLSHTHMLTFNTHWKTITNRLHPERSNPERLTPNIQTPYIQTPNVRQSLSELIKETLMGGRLINIALLVKAH